MKNNVANIFTNFKYSCAIKIKLKWQQPIRHINLLVTCSGNGLQKKKNRNI